MFLCFSPLFSVVQLWNYTKKLFASGSVNIYLLLTEREGRTGEYWPEVVASRGLFDNIHLAIGE